MAHKKKAKGKEYLKLVANKEVDPAMIPPKSDGFGNMPKHPIQKEFNCYDPAAEFFRDEDFV